MSTDEMSSEANEHHLNNLSDAVIDIWLVKIDVPTIHRYVNPLDGVETFVDDSLPLQMSDKVNGGTFNSDNISI